jgi:hypothetical protein
MWNELVIFCVAVVSHWQAYVTGGAVTGIIGVVERLTDWKMPKRAYAAVFLGIFLLVSFFLAWRDQYHEALRVPAQEIQLQDKDRQITELRDRPPQFQVNVPAPVVNIPSQMAYMASTDVSLAAASYKIGGNWTVNGRCANISPSVVAEEALCMNALRVVNTKSNPSGQPIVTNAVTENGYRQFLQNASSVKIDRQSYGPGEGVFATVYSPTIDPQLDEAFRSGSKTILFLADYSWKDGMGKHSNQGCKWLQIYPQMFTGPGTMAPSGTLTWNHCRKHNGLTQ